MKFNVYKFLKNIYPVLIVALIIRAFLIIEFSEIAGDTATYFTVAQNILMHGCVSLSDPLIGNCEPHWGGNHLPLYPAFIALVWFFFGTGSWNIQFAQTMVYILALWRLFVVMRNVNLQSRVTYIILWCLALSPLEVAYTRFILPQTLSQALIIWFCAELMAFWYTPEHRRKLPWLLMLSCAFAIFNRYSGLCLLFPLGVFAFCQYPLKRAVLLYFCWVVLILSPLALWSIRSVSLGLSFPPRLMFNKDLSHDMSGLWRWIKTWENNEQDELVFTFHMFAKGYSGAKLPDKAFVGAKDQHVVLALLNDLKTKNGEPIPRAIDNAFGELADERISQNFWRFRVGIVLERMILLWFKPQNGMGWPTPLTLENGFYKTATQFFKYKEWSSLFDVLGKNFVYVFFKGVAILWRGGLIVVLLLACLMHKRLFSFYRIMVFMAAMLVVGQSVFLGIVCGVDSRLIAEIVPFIEIACVMFLYHIGFLVKEPNGDWVT